MAHQKRNPVFKSAEDDGYEEPIKELLSEPFQGSVNWLEISQEQKTGKYYLVAHGLKDEGVKAFWRKTRRLSHFRWVLNGVWTDTLNQDLIPQPLYYKEI